MRKLAWNPILGAVKSREDSINNALLAAENAKKDIEMYDCSQSVDIMNEIDMVTYCYKKGDPSPKLGVIAQTVEKVMPHAVKQGKEFKQVDFTQLVSLLMATTKVLLSKVSGLETKINALAV